MLRAAILGFLLMLSGCKVGPDYYPPCIDIPESYQYEPKDAKGSINALWWEQFHDPVLISLIEEALVNNKSIWIAAANIDNALGVLTQTRAQLFPQLGYSASGTRERLSQTLATPLVPMVPNPQTTYQALLTGTWDIDIWGRIRRQVEAARADLFATVEARLNVLLSVAASTTNAYLQLRGFDEQLVISKDTLKTYGEALDYFEKQFKYGQVSKMTVAQAATQYEMAAAVIPQVELQIVQTENALSILLGRNPSTIPRGKSIYELTLPDVPSGLPSEILRARPDVMQSEYSLIAANALIGAAKALYFPDISLTGAYGKASEELHNLFKGPSRTWTYTGSIVGPIFTFGAIQGQVEQAKAQERAALFTYEQTIQNAFADVENAFAARQYLTEQLVAQGKLVDASKEYTMLANLQYKEGYSPYFVVLQAQEQLFPAELQWVQTRVQLFSSYVNIYQALGGGWVTKADVISWGD